MSRRAVEQKQFLTVRFGEMKLEPRGATNLLSVSDSSHLSKNVFLFSPFKIQYLVHRAVKKKRRRQRRGEGGWGGYTWSQVWTEVISDWSLISLGINGQTCVCVCVCGWDRDGDKMSGVQFVSQRQGQTDGQTEAGSDWSTPPSLAAATFSCWCERVCNEHTVKVVRAPALQGRPCAVGEPTTSWNLVP